MNLIVLAPHPGPLLVERGEGKWFPFADEIKRCQTLPTAKTPTFKLRMATVFLPTLTSPGAKNWRFHSAWARATSPALISFITGWISWHFMKVFQHIPVR
jgi:hypothetical protein